MFDAYLPPWARHSHPMVSHETRHWRKSRVRWLVRGGSWVSIAVVLVLASACSGTFVLLVAPNPRPIDLVLSVGGVFAFTAFALSALFEGLTNLAITIYAATLIARERETQNWPFLRLTTMTTLEIIGAKLAAIVYIFFETLSLIVLLRLVALGAGLLTAFGAVVLAAASAPVSSTPVQPLPNAPDLWALLAEIDVPLLLGLLVGGVLSVLGWFFGPYFNAVYSSAVGLAVSSLVKSRGAAVPTVFAVQFGIGLAVYTPVQQLSSLGLMSVVGNMAGTPSTGAMVWLGMTPILLTLLLQIGVMAMALVFAYNRLEHLGD